MRDMRDARDESGRVEKGLKRGRVLLSLLTLLSLLSFSAEAQGPMNRLGRLGGLRSQSGARRPMAPSAAPSAAPAAARAGAAGEAGAAEPGGRSIEFNATPVDLVFKVYGELVDKTILKDPQVPQATITLQPRQGQELSDKDKIEAIETVLEMNGIHMEPYGEKFVRAIPRKEVRKEGIPLLMDPEHELGESTKVVSLMLPFKNMSVEDAQKALEGFKSASGILLVFERTNAILITDTEANINRMREIAKAIDVANPVTEVVEYIQIKNANATEIKQVIDSIVQESQKEQEANGKKANVPAQQPQSPRPFGGSLLRRPGQPQQQQAPVNNESMFIGVSEADRGMIRGKVVTIADERSNKILIITNASNMKFFKQVIEALDVETTPDTVVKVYRLKYAEAEDVSDMINDLIGNSVSSKDSKGNQNQNAKKGASGNLTRNTQQAAKKPANQRTGETKAGELNKDNTTVLADKRINGLVVMTNKELVPTIEQIIESMDIKLSQVLIETTIVEVTLGDGLNTGMDWIQKGRQKASKAATHPVTGQPLFYEHIKDTWTDEDENTRTASSLSSKLVPSEFSESSSYTDSKGILHKVEKTASEVAGSVASLDRTGVMNNWFGATSAAVSGGGSSGQAAFGAISNAVGSAFGGSFNFIFNSDELGLAAILQATKTDSRSKYVASPIVMTLDNKEAVINATAMHYLLKGFTSTGNSYSTIAVPDYEQKELGIEIKTTPKINPNGTVMLTVEEKYTQLGNKEEIKYSASNNESGAGGLQSVMVPTTVTREMSSDVLLENGQTVVFGGLTEKSVSESETGIPFLKDIPFIGKWLFSKVDMQEARTELLVFMTPYVLDDAQAAQAEALRRKKTMSDPRPWDDGGWSASNLADPVSKKEQLRRIQDEWKKQDEERKTRLAIEQEKVKRAKALKEMSKEERDLWIKMHKEELEEEQQEELEKKMLDKDSQEELKKLAAEIRSKKLGEAEKDLKKAEAETAAENERGKLDAAKKAKEEGK